jgi:hypothetical protein
MTKFAPDAPVPDVSAESVPVRVEFDMDGQLVVGDIWPGVGVIDLAPQSGQGSRLPEQPEVV